MIDREGVGREEVGEESKGLGLDGDSGESATGRFSISATSTGMISFSLPFHLFGDGHLETGLVDNGITSVVIDREGDTLEGRFGPEVDRRELLSFSPANEDDITSSWTREMGSSGAVCKSAGGGIGVMVFVAIGESSVVE